MIQNFIFVMVVLILLVAAPLTLPKSSKEKQIEPQDDWELMRAIEPESPNVDRRPAFPLERDTPVPPASNPSTSHPQL